MIVNDVVSYAIHFWAGVGLVFTFEPVLPFNLIFLAEIILFAIAVIFDRLYVKRPVRKAWLWLTDSCFLLMGSWASCFLFMPPATELYVMWSLVGLYAVLEVNTGLVDIYR